MSRGREGREQRTRRGVCWAEKCEKQRGQEESCRRQAAVGAEKMWSTGQEEDLDSAVHWR